MRAVVNLNEGWHFFKDCKKGEGCGEGERVNLPHTYNAEDGTDGGNDYFRGKCLYKKTLDKNSLPPAEKYYLEIKGASSVAEVFVGDERLARHEGGYSAFRVDITDALEKSSEISVTVDNSPSDTVYPQMADFTFYGGLYRDVNLIAVPKTHFDLDYLGSPGITVTPTVKGENAEVSVEVFVTDIGAEDEILYTVKNAEGTVIHIERSRKTSACFTIENAHLWQGTKSPYLYSAFASIVRRGEAIDTVLARFGCRSFEIDAERGFILNGKEYPLRGVSRHQDREGVGPALLPEHHREDIDLILDMGANTVRLAHYQHDSYFYDLCDEAGLVVWAEIPYISRHLPLGVENTLSQMRELIAQNYNHPSIVVWGLSNEITIGGSDGAILENHKRLNELCHQMDKTRKTVVAAVSTCPTDEEYLKIPDAVAYNHYFGWYGGEASMNGKWFDEFHKNHPNIPIGCSEYGCEALDWHTSNPTQGDYTEEYQAYYHEELIKQLFARKYLWCTYVWNMFDFGADARSEGGKNGRNHKGLVTMDRKYKKDAYFAYKAWLSDKPFVHIAGKRYAERAEDLTKVTVYSNLDEVELFVNGKSLGKKKSDEHFFYFEVPLCESARLTARAGDCSDECVLKRVDKPNEDYILKDAGAVLNWFDVSAPEGRFSLNDKLSQIMKTAEGRALFEGFAESIKSKAGQGASGFDFSDPGLSAMLGGLTILRLSSMLGMMNVSFTKEELLSLNERLNRIKKP